MIIDIHTHITADSATRFVRLLGRRPFSCKTLLMRMDMEGIDKSVVLPLTNPENADVFGITTNRETRNACGRHADRLIPFCNIDPRAMFNTPTADLSAIMRVYKELGYRGIGEVCANIPITDPRYQNLFHHAGEQHLPLILHVTGRTGGLYGIIDGPRLPGLEQTLKTFPGTTVFGHAPAFWNEIDGNLADDQRETYVKGAISRKGALWTLFATYPNLYGDLSAGSAYNAISRDPNIGDEFLRTFHRQLCFGTDRFTHAREPIPPMLIHVKEALAEGRLTRPQHENIMHRNIERVLSRG